MYKEYFTTVSKHRNMLLTLQTRKGLFSTCQRYHPVSSHLYHSSHWFGMTAAIRVLHARRTSASQSHSNAIVTALSWTIPRLWHWQRPAHTLQLSQFNRDFGFSAAQPAERKHDKCTAEGSTRIYIDGASDELSAVHEAMVPRHCMIDSWSPTCKQPSPGTSHRFQ